MVTVESILGVPALGLRAVQLARAGTDIRWVATSELTDPTPFLEGGEILLTTGIETRHWTTQWDGYVRRLAEAGIAAVGLGIGLTHARTPQALADACREHQVNLFEVPAPTTFVAISRQVARELERQESTAARDALKTQRRLISAAAKPDPRAAVVSALAHALDGAVCLMGPDGRALVGPAGPRRTEFVLGEVAADVRRLRAHGLRSAAARSRPAMTVSVQPIGLRGKPSTYLAAMGPTHPSDGQRHAVTTAVAVLGLVDEQLRGRADTRQRLRDRAIQMLVENDAATAQLVLDVDPPAPQLTERIQFLRATGGESEINEALSTLEYRGVLAGGYTGELCAALGPGHAKTTTAALTDAGLRVGIGDTVALRDAASGYRTAGLALAQATPTAPLVVWGRVVGNGPLGLIDPERAAAFAESWLRALDSEQIETLHSFLRHHGSRLKVAEELGLHRNTVRNRLDAIEAALPGRLDDPQTRVSAWIALQSRRLNP
ncbi:PucR family transcriptional regulator [Mycobacterium sp. NPDC003449]